MLPSTVLYQASCPKGRKMVSSFHIWNKSVCRRSTPSFLSRQTRTPDKQIKGLVFPEHNNFKTAAFYQ